MFLVFFMGTLTYALETFSMARNISYKHLFLSGSYAYLIFISIKLSMFIANDYFEFCNDISDILVDIIDIISIITFSSNEYQFISENLAESSSNSGGTNHPEQPGSDNDDNGDNGDNDDSDDSDEDYDDRTLDGANEKFDQTLDLAKENVETLKQEYLVSPSEGLNSHIQNNQAAIDEAERKVPAMNQSNKSESEKADLINRYSSHLTPDR